MKWAILVVTVASLLAVQRLWSRLHRRDVSAQWVREDERRRAAQGWEGVSYTGRFKR